MCCGIVYAGRYGEVIIDPQLFKPCCRKLPVEEVVEQEVEQKKVEQGGEERMEEGVEQWVEQKKVEVGQQQLEVEQQKVGQQEMVEKVMEEEGHTDTARSSQHPQVQQEVSVSE